MDEMKEAKVKKERAKKETMTYGQIFSMVGRDLNTVKREVKDIINKLNEEIQGFDEQENKLRIEYTKSVRVLRVERRKKESALGKARYLYKQITGEKLLINKGHKRLTAEIVEEEAEKLFPKELQAK